MSLAEQHKEIEAAAQAALKRTPIDTICDLGRKAVKSVRVAPNAHVWVEKMTPEQDKEYILAHSADLIDIAIWAYYEMQRKEEVQHA